MRLVEPINKLNICGLSPFFSMSIHDINNRLFEQIRQIRIDEFKIIKKHLKGKHFQRGLEIGCGDGTQSILLREICEELISTDINASDIPCERLEKLNFVSADAGNLPFPDKYFDLVYSSNVLEHIENLDQAFSEMSRVLTDDGLMIHCLPNATWKILQLTLWFPFRIKILIAKIGEIICKTGKPVENVKSCEFGSQKGAERRKFNPWFPPIHGIAKSHFEEIMLFRMPRWRREFEKAGFAMSESFPLLLYSAWNVGPAPIRIILQSLGLRSSNCFFLNKKL